MNSYHLPAYPGSVLRRGSVGPGVVLLQELLTLAGHPCDVDGDFGPGTERALRAYQGATGLDVDGEAGPATFAALCAPYAAACAPPAREAPATLAEAVAQVAEHLLSMGIRELPGNRGPWVRLFMDGQAGPKWAWCAGFVRHCIRVACAWGGYRAPLEVSPSCDVTASRAQQAGLLRRSVARPERGWLLLRQGERPGDWTHIEVVTGMDGDRVQIIAGNTTDTGSREGVAVLAHAHRLGGYDGVVL